MTFTLTEGRFSGAIGLLWIDLETTGTDENKDDIIEIGSILTDFDFNRFDYRDDRDFSQVIEPTESALGRLMKTPAVRNMHLQNGLLSDCMDSPDRLKSIMQAEANLLNWLDLAVNSKKRRGSASTYKFMLAGSGVGHFDRRFIKRHLPLLDRLLVFAPLDVGMVRRFLTLSGVEPAAAGNKDAKNHRALDDIKLHLEEARAYRDMFNKQFNDPVVFNAKAAEPDPDFEMPDGGIYPK